MALGTGKTTDKTTRRKPQNLKKDDCLAVITEHNGRECKLYPKSTKKEEPFTNIATQAANVRTSIADIRLVGGSRQRASYENTIGAMKQSNGHTY